MPANFPRRAEFIALIAIIMMVIAFAIDTMLPALPEMAHDLGARRANDQQYILTAFTIGMGVATFIMGILSDSLGRRRLLIASLGGYALCSVAGAMSQDFTMLLTARAAQGMAAGGSSVIAAAIVRDLYSGREMAQINSLTSVVFMGAPIVAPALGTLVLVVSDWRTIFVLLALFGAALIVWVAQRLPESLPQAARVPLAFGQVAASARTVIGNRTSVGYAVAIMLIQATIFAYLASVQQVFAMFGRPELLPVGFAIMAVGIAAGSLTNARLVVGLGMRRIGHAAMVAFTAFAALHLAVTASGSESVWTFIVLQTLMMMAFPMTIGNFTALAMEPMGAVAGTASSLQRSFSTIGGAIIGTLIGQQFDGTTVPLFTGVTIAAVTALIAIAVVERGRLFVEPHMAAAVH